MKDTIKKLAEDISKAVTFLKEEKLSEATEALEAVGEGVTTLDAEATEMEAEIEKSKTELATATEAVQKSKEEIKKWASLDVSADSMKALMEELGSVKTMLAEGVGIMKTTSTKSDVEVIEARLDVIEKSKTEQQIKDEKRDDMKKSAFAGLDLTPRN